MANHRAEIDRMSQDLQEGLLISPKRLSSSFSPAVGSHLEGNAVVSSRVAHEGKTGNIASLSDETQMDADLALARVLQEQERRMLLHEINRGRAGSVRSEQSIGDFSRSSSGSFSDDHHHLDDEELEIYSGEHSTNDRTLGSTEVHSGKIGGSERGAGTPAFATSARRGPEDIDDATYNNGGDVVNNESTVLSDEDFARALQEEEYRETTRQLMALAGIRFDNFPQNTDVDSENDLQDSHEDWPVGDSEEDDDVDELSYEELIALGEVVGTQSRGLRRESCERLPRSVYSDSPCDKVTEKVEGCTVCQSEFEGGDELITLPCRHLYHEECILQWLSMNKVCPVCTREVESGSEAGESP